MINYKVLLLVFALCPFSILAHLAEDDELPCAHDNQDVNIETLEVDEDLASTDGRVLASGSYPSIRLYPYFDYLTFGSSEFKNYVKYDLVPPVISFYEAAIKIKHPLQAPLKTADSVKKICDYQIPSLLKTSGVNADYFFFFTASSENTNFAAVASFCYVTAAIGRPVVAKVSFNTKYLKVPGDDPLVHEKNTYLLMHEMMHALGFSNALFKYYVDGNGKPRTNHVKSVKLLGKTRQVLDVPCLTDRVRKHFGCSSLPGAYLENNGDAEITQGSHFERKHFLYDMMTSGVVNGARVSELSLAVLEATGWYVPDYSYGETLFWGAGQGCNFVNSDCPKKQASFEEFCTVSDRRGCAMNGRGGGKCTADKNADGCSYNSPYSDYDCQNPDAAKVTRLPELQVFGRNAGSTCFEGDLSTQENDDPHSFCFTYDCVGSGSNAQLEVQVGNRKVVCKKAGQMEVNGYRGTITCPDPVGFCKSMGKPYCPRNCMGRGKCSNNKCVCNKGFKGVDCGLRI